MMFSYLAVLYCPLGDAMTVIYSGPIFTMLFSYLFLRIRQGLWKIFFALILLVGVILVIRPPFMFPMFHGNNSCGNSTHPFLPTEYVRGNNKLKNLTKILMLDMFQMVYTIETISTG